MNPGSCKKCRHSHVDPQMGNLLLCRRYPPHMTAFTKVYSPTVGAAATATADEQVQTFFNFPVVNPDWSCGEYAITG